MNRLEASSTIPDDLPQEMVPNLGLVNDVFAKLNRDHGLKFADKKGMTIRQYIARFPDNYREATHPKNVLPGYLANGQIDHGSKRVPDLKVMVEGTLDRPMTVVEWKLVRSRMPDVCSLLLEHGWISDETFVQWGFPADTNLSGAEVFRPDSIFQEHLQRAKLMDHPHQRAKRLKLAEDNAAEENQKLEKHRNTVNLYLKLSMEAEQELYEKMHSSSNGIPMVFRVSDATLEHFANVKRDRLKGFILARKFDVLGRSHGIPSKKGDYASSLSPTSETLIRVAYAYRNKPVILKEIPEVTTSGASAKGPRPVPVVAQFHARGDYSNLRFAVTNEWVTNVKAAFDPFDVTSLVIGDVDLVSVQEQINLLHDVLQERLTSHIEQRCTPDLKNHWYWYFVRDNIGVEAAILVLFKQVKDDLEPAKWDPDASLFRNVVDNTFILIENRIRDMEGSYVFYDKVRGRMIRTGKACGKASGVARTLAARCWGRKGHQECASSPSLTRNDSKFYRSYPSRSATEFVCGSRRGYFEDLQAFCLRGFHRGSSESITPIVETEDPKKGIYKWSQSTLDRLGKTDSSTALNDKLLEAASYLSETCGELCLSPTDNVSQSQGGEKYMGGSVSVNA